MNRDDVHTRQSPVHRKMLNLNRFCHHDSGKIWTMAEYWTIQPRRFGEGEATIRMAESVEDHLQSHAENVSGVRR
jgi:hypothetical protein